MHEYMSEYRAVARCRGRVCTLYCTLYCTASSTTSTTTAQLATTAPALPCTHYYSALCAHAHLCLCISPAQAAGGRALVPSGLTARRARCEALTDALQAAAAAPEVDISSPLTR
jgi:hypothetical protein